MQNENILYQPTKKEIQEIKDAFDLFDINGDRKVHVKEIKIAMRSLGFEPSESDLQILTQQEKDEFVEEQIFFNLMFQKIQETNPTEMIKQAFELFVGQSGSKYITVEDLKRVAIETQIDISDNQIKQIMESADKDRNGTISYDEFKKVIKKTHLFQLIRFLSYYLIQIIEKLIINKKMMQQEVIKGALIIENLNFLNTIYDDRFGEIHLFNNKVNKKEYVMGKDKYLFSEDQLKKEIEKLKALQIKIHPNFLHLLDFQITKTSVYDQQCFQITKYFEYSNGSLKNYIEKLKNEPNFQFKEEFIARLLYDLLDAIDFVDSNKLQCGIISPKNIIVEKQGLHSNKLIPIFNNKGYSQQFVKPDESKGYYLSPRCYNFYSHGKEYQQSKKDLYFSLGLVVLEMCLEYPVCKIYTPSFQSKVLINMLKKFIRKYGRNHALSTTLNYLLGINLTQNIESIKNSLIQIINPEDSSDEEKDSESDDDYKEKSTNNSLSPRVDTTNQYIDSIKKIQRNPLCINLESTQPIIENKYGLRVSRQISIERQQSPPQKQIQIKQIFMKENSSQNKFEKLYIELKSKREVQKKPLLKKLHKNFKSDKILTKNNNFIEKNQDSNSNSKFTKKEKTRRIDFRQISNNYKNTDTIPIKELVTTPIKKPTRISLLNNNSYSFRWNQNKTHKQYLKQNLISYNKIL